MLLQYKQISGERNVPYSVVDYLLCVQYGRLIDFVTMDNKENFKPRKRFRNPKSHKNFINRIQREKGLAYTTKSGKEVAAKKFTKIICKCRKSCHLTINEIQQKKVFDEYYNLCSWNEKTSFLLNHIEVSSCKKRRKAPLRKNIMFKKSFHREYFLVNKENKVCKSFFKAVLQITEGRIEHCMRKKQTKFNSCAIDYRGKHSHHKRTSSNTILNAVQFINSFPKYESHYTRNTSPSGSKKYLAANLNLKTLYNEYKQQCENPISMYMFRDTFYRKFNLRFKPPSQDTCDICNKLDMKTKAAPIKSIERMKFIQQKTDHQQLIEYLETEYKEHKSESKLNGGEKILLIFDLEKVFPTPKLTTNKVYYKRQLNTYNFCVHDETHNRSYMYVWHEGIASRGPQEITSCLIYHITHFIPKECRDIIAYSDSCGGQNRNVKTSIMLSHLLARSTHLQSITQHFYHPGHSYNVCDRKFAIIEKKRKKVEKIHVPGEWIDVIKNAKETDPKFEVIEMDSSQFFSCEELLKQFCTNRKKTVDKNDLNWLTFRKICYKQSAPLELFFETYGDVLSKFDEKLEFKPDLTKTVSIRKKGMKNEDFIGATLPLLYPFGKHISTAKKSDLLELLDFIPIQHHKFYANLKHSENDEPDEDIEQFADLIVVSDDESQ